MCVEGSATNCGDKGDFVSAIDIRAIPTQELASHGHAFAQMRGVSAAVCNTELRFMDWWLYRSPAGEGVYAGAFDGNRLVGAFGFGIETFIINGRQVRVGIYCNAFTNSEYRGKGLFSQLCAFLVESAGRLGCEAVFAWANPTASRIFLTRLGYSALFYPISYTRPLDWGPLTRRLGPFSGPAARAVQRAYDGLFRTSLGSYEASSGPVADDEWAALLRDHHRGHSCSVERTPQYLAWRLHNPDCEYLQIQIRERGELRAWAAARLPGPHEPPRLRVGAIVCPASGRPLLVALVSALLKEAKSRDLGRVSGIGRLSRTLALLTTMGFVGRRGRTPIVGIATEGATLEQFKHWDFQDMDVDVF